MTLGLQFPPGRPEYSEFLFEILGKDGNRRQMTVLAVLARMGLDPWHEAARLSDLSPDAARIALATLVANIGDIALDVSDTRKIVHRLLGRLPRRREEPVRANISTESGKQYPVSCSLCSVPNRRTIP